MERREGMEVEISLEIQFSSTSLIIFVSILFSLPEITLREYQSITIVYLPPSILETNSDNPKSTKTVERATPKM